MQDQYWIFKKDQLGESNSTEMNFLFNDGKCFVMDNHLAAGWCWLQRINKDSAYNFFHVDRHYDLLDFPLTVESEITSKGVDLATQTFPEYLRLKQKLKGGEEVQMFRFDNYIMNVFLAYPNLLRDGYFATHDDGNRIDRVITYEPSILDLPSNVHYWTTRSKCPWIFNLDIDYFFKEDSNGQLYQFLSDDYVLELAVDIKRSIPNIEVVTIALSPGFCGGWSNAIRVSKMITDILEVNFDTECLKF